MEGLKVAALLAPTSIKEILKLWNILSTERYNLYTGAVLFLTAPHCQFRGVNQGMKQTYMYL
jgi:hypothetical protein